MTKHLPNTKVELSCLARGSLHPTERQGSPLAQPNHKTTDRVIAALKVRQAFAEAR
jgi:hypothetical protein